MIQRIQSLYLLIAVILIALCIAAPIGHFVPLGSGETLAMYNIRVAAPDGSIRPDYIVCPLLVVKIVLLWFTATNILRYRSRRRQAKRCTTLAMLHVVWYVLYIVFALTARDLNDYTFRPGYAAVFPLISFILTLLARRAILKDDHLVRSVDRIR